MLSYKMLVLISTIMRTIRMIYFAVIKSKLIQVRLHSFSILIDSIPKNKKI